MAAKNKLVGQNYTTPDLVAKVTGKAKYAEDFRVDGMLFAKLLCSPMPHARVQEHRHQRGAGHAGRQGDPDRRRSARRPPTSSPTSAQTIKANPKGERALTNEPLYFGEPILAVAAVDEDDRGRGDREDPDRVRAAAARGRSAGQPAARRSESARLEGNIWGRPAGASPASRRRPVEVQELKWTEADFAEYDEGKLPMGKTPDEWSYGDLEAGFKNAALVLDETFVDAEHQPSDARAAHRAGLLAERQAVPARRHAEHGADGRLDRPLDADGRRRTSSSSASTPAAASAARRPARSTSMIPALLSKKTDMPGHAPHHARRGALHRRRASEPARPRQGRLRQRAAASPRSTCSSSATTVPTSRATIPAAPAAWCRCSISRRRCGGAASRS